MKLLLLLLAVTSAYSYKILGIFPAPTHSHAILSKGIVDSLLNAGHQVLCALSFLGTGSYQRIIGKNVDTYVSQPSASRAIRQVVEALNSPDVVRKYIRFPQNFNERQALKERFYQKFRIPGAIACIDGTLVAMTRPSENEERYYCRKGYHARNVLIVSWASPYSHWKPHPNLTLIDISDNEKLLHGVDMMSSENGELKFIGMMARNFSKVTVESKELRQAIISEKFDAVVTEWFFSDTDAGYAAILQVPWIQIFGTGISPNVELQVDELRSTSTIPLLFNSFPVPMNFFQRVTNTFTTFLVLFMEQLSGSSPSARYESYFTPLAAARGVPLPPYSDAYYNVSIQFVNSHPSIGYAQSLPPNVIDIAGYHIEEPEPLPKDVQAILDSSPQGVVYFSMGSVLKSAMFPEHTRRALVAMLGALPYTVLWKFEEELQGLPGNIIVKKWWPQSAVLAHPNIKLFITHGGMLSTLEAVQNGIPLLTIPVFGDQPSNAARAERLGYSLSVPFSVDMAPALKVALNEMLSTDRFYKQAKFLSRIFNNRPVHPSKLISHYIELAIESKGAYHLRSKTHLYPWYQRWMLDQLAALAALLYALYALLRALLTRALFTKKDSKKVKRN